MTLLNVGPVRDLRALAPLLARRLRANWGDTSMEDAPANDRDLATQTGRLMPSYLLEDEKVSIITEPRVTTIVLEELRRQFFCDEHLIASRLEEFAAKVRRYCTVETRGNVDVSPELKGAKNQLQVALSVEQSRPARTPRFRRTFRSSNFPRAP